MITGLDDIKFWGPGREGAEWSEAVPYDHEVTRHRFIWAHLKHDTEPKARVRVAGCMWELDGPVMGFWAANHFDRIWRLLVVYRRVTDPVCGPFS